jgi:hypothetical protein
MTPERPNPARGGAAGSEVVCSAASLPIAPNPTSSQAEILPRRCGARRLRLVPPAPPPRPRRIEVMIAARDGPAPIGRTRPLRLTEPDLEQLVDFALRLEELA